MNRLARVIGRLIGILIFKEVINKEEAEFILEPLEEGETE